MGGHENGGQEGMGLRFLRSQPVTLLSPHLRAQPPLLFSWGLRQEQSGEFRVGLHLACRASSSSSTESAFQGQSYVSHTGWESSPCGSLASPDHLPRGKRPGFGFCRATNWSFDLRPITALPGLISSAARRPYSCQCCSHRLQARGASGQGSQSSF